MDDFVVNVRQITQYQLTQALASDRLLLQRGGIGGPYLSSPAADLIIGAMAGAGPLGISAPVPNDALPMQLLTRTASLADGIGFNAYAFLDGSWQPLNAGTAATLRLRANLICFDWLDTSPTGFTPLMSLSPSGTALNTPLSIRGHSISVGRPPIAPNEVATAQWVTDNSVWRFNGRRGDVNLWLSDITRVGGAPIDSPSFIGCPLVPDIEDLNQSDLQAVNSRFVQRLIGQRVMDVFTGHPLVFSFNGRSGDICLSLADILKAGGAPLESPYFTGFPRAPTPPQADTSDRIATTRYVRRMLGVFEDEIGWQFYEINNDINNRFQTLTDELTRNIYQLIQDHVAGVISFNGRSGEVTLIYQDLIDAGYVPTPPPPVFTSTVNGLVPPPQTLPKDVMLKADATWGYPRGNLINNLAVNASYVAQPEDGTIFMPSSNNPATMFTLPDPGTLPPGKTFRLVMSSGLYGGGVLTINIEGGSGRAFTFSRYVNSTTINWPSSPTIVINAPSGTIFGIDLLFVVNRPDWTTYWVYNEGGPLPVTFGSQGAQTIPGRINPGPGLVPTTVGNLPAADSVPIGTRVIVTDATRRTGLVGTTADHIQGGGTLVVPLISSGTQWLSDLGYADAAGGQIVYSASASLAGDHSLTFQPGSELIDFGTYAASTNSATLRMHERTGGRSINIYPSDPTNDLSVDLILASAQGAGGGCRIGGSINTFMSHAIIGWAYDGTVPANFATNYNNNRTGIGRPVDGMLEINNGMTAGTRAYLRLNSGSVGALPAASPTYLGARSTVNDATSITFGDVAAGGGSNIAPVWCDGVNWRIG